MAPVAHAQTAGEVVQAQLDAAIAAGQTVYTLPAGPIHLTRALVIPSGTRNLTIQGQAGTQLVRTSANTFPMLMVGNDFSYGFLNEGFSSMPRTVPQPIAEGAKVLQLPAGHAVVPGWYALLGTQASTDSVTHAAGNPTFWTRRELIRVVSVSGNTATLSEPVGRDFPAPELRLLEPDTALPRDRMISRNITLRNFSINGQSTINQGFNEKNLVASLVHNFTVDDVSILGFGTAGLSVQLGRGVLVNRLRAQNGRLDHTGYSVEFAGTRFTTLRNSTFTRVRSAVTHMGGAMDSLVEDISAPEAIVDASHGQMERRILFRRVNANVIQIANSMWRGGASGVRIVDSTARSQIWLQAGAEDVVIQGMLPGQNITTPIIFLFTEQGGSGTGNTQPIGVGTVTLIDGATTGVLPNAVNIQTTSSTGAISRIGSLTVRNWTFRNPNTQFGGNIWIGSLATVTPITIENSQFHTTAQWSAPIFLGPATGNGQVQLQLRNAQFNTPTPMAILVDRNGRAAIQATSTVLNNTPLSNQHLNGATLQITTQ